MIDVRKILCTTDYSNCADSALPVAAGLADMLGAELHLLHVVELHGDGPEKKAFGDLEERAHALDLKQASLVTAQERVVSVAPGILEYIEEHAIDLVVLATHGRRGVRHFLLGSVAEEVVQRSQCPVLTVRQPPPLSELLFPQRILVPVDLSDHSIAAVSHAREVAKMTGATLQLLHVLEQPVIPSYYDAPLLSSTITDGQTVKDARKAIEKLYAEAGGPEVSFGVHVEVGMTVDTIIAFAEENSSELLVLSSHGLTGLSHLLLGSVAEKVVRRATCPVLTVKSFGKPLLKEDAA